MTGDFRAFCYEVAGRELCAERSLTTVARIENAIGAIDPFALRLEKGLITFGELTRFYAALGRSDPNQPSREELEDWLFSQGLFVHKHVAYFAVTLILGNAAFAREMARLERADGTTETAQRARSDQIEEAIMSLPRQA